MHISPFVADPPKGEAHPRTGDVPEPEPAFVLAGRAGIALAHDTARPVRAGNDEHLGGAR